MLSLNNSMSNAFEYHDCNGLDKKYLKYVTHLLEAPWIRILANWATPRDSPS